MNLIREDILNDRMPMVLDRYKKLSSSLDDLVIDNTVRKELKKELDKNIKSTSHTVPEFETYAILILVISTFTGIVLSRKVSFGSLNYN